MKIAVLRNGTDLEDLQSQKLWTRQNIGSEVDDLKNPAEPCHVDNMNTMLQRQMFTNKVATEHENKFQGLLFEVSHYSLSEQIQSY